MKTATAFATTYKIVICCIKSDSFHYISTNGKNSNNSPSNIYAEKLIP